MSVLLANIADSLLPHLQGKSELEKWETCAKDFPWYPMPWLAMAKNGDTGSKQKAALWMEDEQRLHFLLNADSFSQDIWLLKNFDSVEENTLTANLISEKEQAIPLEPNDIFLTETEEKLTTETKTVAAEENNFPQKFTLAGKFEQEDETAEEEDANNTDFTEPADTDIAPLQLNLAKTNENQPIGKNIPREITIEDNIAIEETTLLEPSTNVAAATEKTAPVVIVEAKDESPITSTSNAHSETVSEPLAFEPYHVVDYFASQGIKVDINDLPKTQLDRQMKSFTQWLKTMKKVAPAQESTAATDPVVDAHATSSLIKEDVITEAMAEVLEKQGMDKKAVEVYEKLILLHPEKSTFFAARIKDLKNK